MIELTNNGSPTDLSSFDDGRRTQTLVRLVAERPSAPAQLEIANMHCHSFYSYNADGRSPAALAWLARQERIKLMGLVDFDVLDGVDEFLDTCEALGVRGAAGIETRVFIPEFADREINSPGEPGVLYHMGTGFTSSKAPPAVAPILDELRQQSTARNLGMIARVNAYLDPVMVDYEADVLPLTPAGNATERHIVSAYIAVAARDFDDPTTFWADRLGASQAKMAEVMQNRAALENLVRAKLMKRGGVAYVQPSHDTFPRVETFHELIVGCGALPCAAWLDGMSEGEQAMEELLTLLIDKGAVTFNIVPDRNWNIADPAVKAQKLANLYAIVELVQDLALPILVGTEMNSPGLKMVDDFDTPELAPVRDIFMDGAYFVYGHTIMKRHAGLGYGSEWAQEHLPTRRERNEFYAAIGRQVVPGLASMAKIRELTPAMQPVKIIEKF